MAVTSKQDAFSFIASEDGKWRFSRVRNWLDQSPVEDRITVPGLVFRERSEWSSPWYVQLILSLDEKLALCWAHAWRVRSGEDEFVSLVDLDSFKLVASLHSSLTAGLHGEYRQYHFDKAGNLFAQAYAALPRPSRDAPFKNRVTLAKLSPSDLAVLSECEYVEWQSGREVHREDAAGCSDLLASVSAASLDELFGRFADTDWEKNRRNTNEAARPAACAFLGYSVSISPDHRLKKEICQDSHRGFWGNIVVTKSAENIYSTKTGELLGTVKESTRASVKSEFAMLNGRDYLLFMEGGTRLIVYEIRE